MVDWGGVSGDCGFVDTEEAVMLTDVFSLREGCWHICFDGSVHKPFIFEGFLGMSN